jgi:hypothetical protein
MCPYYLDGDRTLRFRGGSVIPVAAPLIEGAAMWLLCSFQGPQGGAPRDSRTRSLKTQQHAPAKAARYVQLAGPGSVDILGRTVGDHGIKRNARSSRKRRDKGDAPAMAPCCTGPITGLPRKEVIQPHLPVRLPCYDFTPVTSPTFDGSLPCGLGHRLRVLLTPVV